MWCKNCSLETNNSTCPVCGEKTSSDFPTEIFWCENCAVPLIKNVSEQRKEICPLCGDKTKHLANDLRPVFPEEKLLLAALLDKDLQFFMNLSVWASAGRYFVNGKSVLVSAKKFPMPRRITLTSTKTSVNLFAPIDSGCLRSRTRLFLS